MVEFDESEFDKTLIAEEKAKDTTPKRSWRQRIVDTAKWCVGWK
jgi:hypothetical protein